jgi:hypothetical protein
MSAHVNACFMSCDPPEGGGGEKFYVVVMEEVTIYGHSTDGFTKEKYPEDWPQTLAARKRGQEFGCFHSQLCPNGELGYADMGTLREISYSEFIEARDGFWPVLLDSAMTTDAPVASVGYFDEDGNYVETWNSRDGTADRG